MVITNMLTNSWFYANKILLLLVPIIDHKVSIIRANILPDIPSIYFKAMIYKDTFNSFQLITANSSRNSNISGKYS